MRSKIKYFLCLMLASAMFVPVAGARVIPVECNLFSGETPHADNIGVIEFDDSDYKVCVTSGGVVAGASSTYGWTDYLGPMFFDNLEIDMVTGVWSGEAYAPLNAYDYESDYGIWFDLSGVSTDMATGAVSGEVCDVGGKLGCFEFGGITMELPAFDLSAVVGYEVFGNERDGVPVADGESGWNVVFTVDFSDAPYEVTEDYLNDDFVFGGNIDPTEASDLRLDQVDLTGAANDAVSMGAFELTNFGADFAEYTASVVSFAPTSDEICVNSTVDDFEYCAASGHAYTLGEFEIMSDSARDFTWFVDGEELATVDGDATTALGESLSFAPLYELEDFGLIGVEDIGDLPVLAVGDDYDFMMYLVQNGPGALVEEYGLYFEYEVTDDEFGFGNVDTESSLTDMAFPDVGLLNDNAAITDIGLFGEGTLDDNSGALASSYIWIGFDEGEVHYPSQYFSFIDRYYAPDEEVWVIGTVSGFAESGDVTVVGDVSKMEIRSAVFEQVMGIIRGISGSVGAGTVDADFEASGGRSLIDGSVLYFTGDVEIWGGTIDESVTVLVVGGDVYVDGDVLKGDGELGIIVLEDEGFGGDLYVDSGVTDLHANIILDGSLYRDAASGQFYILGSLVSENTIGGTDDCVLGDGEVGDCVEAAAQDLAGMSSFQTCYPYIGDDPLEINEDMNYLEECPGYPASEYEGAYWLYPVIIEYSPPSEDLPVFNVSGSLVN